MDALAWGSMLTKFDIVVKKLTDNMAHNKSRVISDCDVRRRGSMSIDTQNELLASHKQMKAQLKALTK